MQIKSKLTTLSSNEIKELISYGEKILPLEKHDSWINYINSREDEFLEMDAIAALSLIIELNKGTDINYVVYRVNRQIYSGRAYSSILSMVCLFSNRGEELVNALRIASLERQVVSQR